MIIIQPNYTFLLQAFPLQKNLPRFVSLRTNNRCCKWRYMKPMFTHREIDCLVVTHMSFFFSHQTSSIRLPDSLNVDDFHPTSGASFPSSSLSLWPWGKHWPGPSTSLEIARCPVEKSRGMNWLAMGVDSWEKSLLIHPKLNHDVFSGVSKKQALNKWLHRLGGHP